MAQIQGDVIVLQALHDVAVQAGGIGHQLYAGQHLGALQGHAARHDQADIAAAQDDHAAAGHIALEVDKLLRGAGAVDAGAAGAGNGQRAAGTLAAAHGQHNSLGLEHLQAPLAGDGGDGLIGIHAQHGYARAHVDAHFSGLVDITLGVFGAGQLFLKAMQAEAVVDALAQDAAGIVLAFQHDQAVHARLLGGDGGGQTRRARADDQDIHLGYGYAVIHFTLHRGAPP